MQSAHPNPNTADSQSGGLASSDRWPIPSGNPRIGPGMGGTDKATVAKMDIRPVTGQSLDDRTRMTGAR